MRQTLRLKSVPVILAGCLLVVVGQACARGGPNEASAPRGENIALHRPYTVTPAPNYALCTDEDDRTQLTDGVKAGSRWPRKTTVGWRAPSKVPRVVIDLGRPEPIEEVRVHTNGNGRTHVSYPAQILVLVGDSPESLQLVAALDDREAPQQDEAKPQRIPYVFRAGNLNARGRYVCVTLVPNRMFLFLDEVEVFRSTRPVAKEHTATQERFAEGDIRRLVRMHRRALRVSREIDEFASLGNLASGTSGVNQALAALQAKAASASPHEEEEWDALDTSLRSLRGRWLAERHMGPLVWRQADPMEQVRENDVFLEPSKERAGLEVDLWEGEYESAALTVVNCSRRDVRLRVSLTPLRAPSGEEISAQDVIVLRRAVFVDAPGVGRIGDALVKLSDSVLLIPGGSAGQLWLTMHSPRLRPGEYRFAVSLRSVADGRTTEPDALVQGRIVVYACRFPARIPLKTYTWAYSSRISRTERGRASIIEDLKAHYVNTHILPAEDCPVGKIGATGALTVDFARHDAALRLFPDADQYLFGMGGGSRKGIGARFKRLGEWMSPPWRSAMRTYLTRWVAHLRGLGIGYDRFAMYPFDESLCDEFFALAKFIKQEVDPNIRIFANRPGTKKGGELERFAPYIDVWCLPEYSSLSAGARLKLRQRGKDQIWRYAAKQYASALSPYKYYRLQPWRTWAAGDTGCGFWVYAARPYEPPCDAWDEVDCTWGRCTAMYNSRGGPVDCGGETLIPSRRWEAWREGIEDYAYLSELRDAIRRARTAGREGDADRAQRVLDRVVKDVLEGEGSSATVYRARRQLTETMLRLDRS